MGRDQFCVGELYTHKSIMNGLKVGNSGGVRVAISEKGNVARIVLFSSAEQEANPQEIPYQDHTEGSLLTYTGSGKIGNQNLTGANLRLTQQPEAFFPIYVFSLHSHRKTPGSPDKRWRFSGIFRYLDHNRQDQADLIGTAREAWVFRLLKLPIENAHLDFEFDLVREIAGSFVDPGFTAHLELPESCKFKEEDIRKSISRMGALEPVQFEHFIKRTLIASHFREVRVTKKSADGGIDVIARMPATLWPLDSQIIQVQAKRWQRPIGRREVAELRGSLLPKAIGVMITTGQYARTAILEADRQNQLPISLVDGHKLAVVGLHLNLEID